MPVPATHPTLHFLPSVGYMLTINPTVGYLKATLKLIIALL